MEQIAHNWWYCSEILSIRRHPHEHYQWFKHSFIDLNHRNNVVA